MASFRSFEEIEAWQAGRELVKQVYAITGQGAFLKDFGLRDQIRRAATSIMSNIAEGFERDWKGEFVQYLAVAKGSAGEVRSQLYIALDQGYLTQSRFNELTELVLKTSRMTGGLMNYLRGSKIRGTKFK